jgi:cyclophilin family peptidyl-prolyl cis-trans isomerase
MKNHMMLRLLAVLAVASVGITAVSCSQPKTESVTPPATTGQPPQGWVQLPTQIKGDKVLQWKEAPKMMIDTGKQYRAIMETEHGKMVLELFAKDVPKTVNNFVFLATNGYYDNTTFHRVLADFMAQGGDPTGTGSGSPGYIFANEITSHKHVTGALSMANAGPNTNGSQFFICFQAQPTLDGNYSVFGQLVEGMDVLKSIKLRDPNKNPQFGGDKLLSVRIEVKEGS